MTVVTTESELEAVIPLQRYKEKLIPANELKLINNKILILKKVKTICRFREN